MPGRQNGQLLEVGDAVDGRRAAEDMCSHCLRLPAGQDLRPARARAARAGGAGACVASGQRPHRTLGCLDRRGPRERANIRGGEGRAGGPPRSFEGRAPKKKVTARATGEVCELCGEGCAGGGARGCRTWHVDGARRWRFVDGVARPPARRRPGPIHTLQTYARRRRAPPRPVKDEDR